MQSRSWAGLAGRVKTENRSRGRGAAIAAGAAVLSAAAAGGMVLGASPAGAAVAAPAAKAAASGNGFLYCAPPAQYYSQRGNNDMGNWWASADQAWSNGKNVGTCVRQVREYVTYPRSETLTWTVKVDGKRVGTENVYGTAGSTHYLTWNVDGWVAFPKMPQVCITAGSHWSCKQIPAEASLAG